MSAVPGQRPQRLLVSVRGHEAEQALQTAYGAAVRWRPDEDGRLAVDLQAAAIDGMSTTRARFEGGVTATRPPMVETVTSVRVHAGECAVDDGRARRRAVHGEWFLLHPDRTVTATMTGAALSNVLLDRAAVTGVATQVAPWHRGPLRLDGQHAVSGELGDLWTRATEAVQRSLLEGDALASPLVHASVRHHLASLAIVVFGLVEAHDERTPAPAAVRRAMRYLDDHAAEPVSIGDAAQAAGVGERALQAAFRRSLGTTPSEYLRRARLDAARRELQAADGASTTVAAVAARWGFAHPGRFASRYAAAFGEAPSRTLDR